MSIVDSFLTQLEGIWNTISTVIQLIIMTLKNLVFFLQSFLKGLAFAFEAFAFLPPFILPIIGVIIAVMILREMINH